MLKPGMMLCDRYEILDVVGAGGMSIVYKARCHRLNRNVAIKVLKPEFSNDKNFVTKFRIEAQASAGLTHPNIVNVYDVYDDDGMYFIVMELVDGITLKDYIDQNGRLSMDKAIDFSIQIAAGLEAAHESHIIHRDIKPQNIIVAKNGNIKVTDFGIAKAASPNTLTSGAMGSVHYISPEQARGGYSDERSDIYSLGITMYEMVTGRVPFDGDNNVSIALMHIQNDMIPPRQYYPDIYSSFEKVILKATQKKPERRYLTASALIADLRRVQNNPNIDIVVAPTAVTNSPTQEWTKEDVKAIRDGSAQMEDTGDMYQNNTPFPNEMGELKSIKSIQTISTIPVNNSRLNQLLSEEDDWEDEEDEDVYVPPVRSGSIKKVQDNDDDDDDYGDEGDMDPKLRKAVIAAGIATAVIIAIVIMVVLGKFMGWFKFGDKKNDTKPSESEQIEDLVMIDVLGVSQSAAVKMLDREGFTNVKVVEEENQETQEGYVFEQSVKEGEVIPADTEIILKVSKGAEEIDVPNVVGYTDEQAVQVLTESGNFEVAHAFDYDDEVEEDRVIRQDPVAGTKAPKGTKVTITISNGSQIKEVSAPNLQGMNESQATNTLTGLKLVVGPIKHEHSDTVPEGQVIRQDITAGTKLKEGDTLGFTISDGPEPRAATYTAHINGAITCSDSALDGQAVTIQLYYNGSKVAEKTETVLNGTSYNLSASIPGLSDKDSSAGASVVCVDGAGNDVTSLFSVTTPITVSYTEE